MRQQTSVPVNNPLRSWQIAWWLVCFGGVLFFWPTCLDRYLAPRFFFLSAALGVAFWLVWKNLRSTDNWRLHLLDLLLLGWYGLNLASVSWAFSWSEGIFYAQKTGLLLFAYGFLRISLQQQETALRLTLQKIIPALGWVLSAILIAQLFWAFLQHGFDNEALYDYASALSGNKSLASNLLFFILLLQALFKREAPQQRNFWLLNGILLLLLLLLQTRTVYVALAAAIFVYVPGRMAIDADFRPWFLKKILPAGVLAMCLLGALLAWKGQGSSLAERLNPLTYLESQTANERRFVWYKTELLNRDHPLLGVGNGSWKFWFPSKSLEGGYRMEEKNVVFTRAHNDYLEIQAEMGWVGLLWFCALFLVAMGLALWAFTRTAAPLERRQDALLLFAGLLGYCIIQFFDFPRERIEMQLLLALLFALAVHGAGGRFQTGIQLPKSFWALLAGLSLSFSVIIGVYRMKGDIHHVKMLEAQSDGKWNALVKESEAAESAFYEYSDVAIPLAWHEGIAWYQLRQMDKAVSAFEKAYRLNPWSFQVINNYASALVQKNRFREAIPLYEQTLAINPSFDDGKFNLAHVYTQLNDYPRALEWLGKVDTIVQPANPEDRETNRRTLARQAEFRKTILEKMK